jgi:ABC-type maltose transport system permease subunit
LRVTLPLALPSIAVAALLAFLIGYTEFAIGWLFVESSQNVTLAMAVSAILRGTGASWANVAALALMMSAPVVVIFLVLQRYLLDRLLIGSVEV